ncbi:MAG: type II secretion system protein [Sedimentisphaerales bacterium]|nr:type II secretion system protein [Sedimentisphaerales bacterium]
MHKRRGFTIVELMVVIMIIGILASLMAPMMRARVDKSKWSEACTSAGAVRTAVRDYAAEASITAAKMLIGSNMGDVTTQDALGFTPEDLKGTYFSPSDYSINSVSDNGIASIKVTSGSKDSSPSGSYVLQEDGKWVMQ